MYRIPFDRVNWTTSIFLISTALIALVGVPIYLVNFGIDWFQFGMFFFYATATTMSITLGYHRLFSHLSFKAKRPVKFFTLVFGACAFENSCLDWSADHRLHHKHVDHDDDPYDISKGFMWAHIGWLMFKLKPEPPMNNVNDLKKDKLVMWQYKYVHWIGLFVGLMLVLGLAKLPKDINFTQLLGIAFACGIGFTMSLFISGLAFEHNSADYFAGDRLGILAGSTLSAVIAYIILHLSLPKSKTQT